MLLQFPKRSCPPGAPEPRHLQHLQHLRHRRCRRKPLARGRRMQVGVGRSSQVFSGKRWLSCFIFWIELEDGFQLWTHFFFRTVCFFGCFCFCKIKQFKRSYEPLLLKWDGDDYNILQTWIEMVVKWSGWFIPPEEGMFLVAGNMCRSQTVKFQVEVGFLQCLARKSHGKHHEISWQGALLQIPCGEFLPSWKEVRSVSFHILNLAHVVSR